MYIKTLNFVFTREIGADNSIDLVHGITKIVVRVRFVNVIALSFLYKAEVQMIN